jgi:hypothetical protein
MFLVGFNGKRAFHTSTFPTQVLLVQSHIGFGQHFLTPHIWTSLTIKLLVSLDLEFMAIEVLLLQSNHLTGSVPRLSRSIGLLDISNNSLDGQLPSNFGGPHFQIAVLFSNRITGTIPDSICQSRQLRLLDFSNNLLTGGAS